MSKSNLVSPEELIDRFSTAFRESQILLTANRLRLFPALAHTPRSAMELAQMLGADGRGLRILCDSLAGLGILMKEEGRYRIHPGFESLLLPEGANSKVAQLDHMARLYAKWGHLLDSVMSGGPVSDDLIPADLVQGKRAFARAMADSARDSARLTAEKLRLRGIRRLLDIGGGPGVFAIELARNNPLLEVEILDDAETLAIAREKITGAGLEGRIRLRPGDAFADDLGTGYQFIFCSNLVHIYPAEANQSLVRRCALALEPGGRIGIKDFFLDDNRKGPAWALMFAVNMLINTEAGDCHTRSEVQAWFERAGLTLEEEIEITERSLLFVARK